MNTLERSIRSLYGRIFYTFPREIAIAVGDSKTLLDVGCGKNSPVQTLGSKIHKTGLDLFEPSLIESKKKNIHQAYKVANVLSLVHTFEEKSFDCVFASELIEHLEKDEGFELLRQMEKVARKRVVITTPVGFLPQESFENNPWQIHCSGWSVEEMRNRGYSVVGLNGAKFVWNMKFLWGKNEGAMLPIRLLRKLLVTITNLYTRNHPQYAFQMLCVKEVANT